MSTATIPALTVRRTYPVSRQRLYEAWTTPEIASKFLGGTGDVVSEVKKMDLRVGGSYEILMKNTSFGDIEVVGMYSEVIPNEKLVMTWRWREDDPKDEFDTHLTLEFHDVEGGAEVVLTHYGFASQQSRDNHEEGWTDIAEAAATFIN
jgi:uncharacterized protein YndB with AHSA1/START domain